MVTNSATVTDSMVVEKVSERLQREREQQAMQERHEGSETRVVKNLQREGFRDYVPVDSECKTIITLQEDRHGERTEQRCAQCGEVHEFKLGDFPWQ